MRIGDGVLLLLGAALGPGCSGPALDVPQRPDVQLKVDFEPATADGSVPLVFRARLRDAPESGSPWLFRGEVSDYYARSLKRGDVPSALRERAVSLRFWRDAQDCWLQPVEWLDADVSYTLAFTGVGVVRVVLAQPEQGRPARRLFPPPGSHKYRAAVVCDIADESPWSSLQLEPGGIALHAASGVAGQPSAGCVTLEVEAALREAVVAPPLLAGAAFEPSPWLPLPPAFAETPPACTVGEAFHGACLEVLDDRLRVTPVAQDLLFTLDAPAGAVLAARAGARALLLRGLSPETALTFSGSVLSSSGKLEPFRSTVTTGATRRHLVLNEVLANPVGPEPDSEWLELVNDSERSALLSELWLEDAGGHVRLPDGELAAGEIALVVSEGFRASSLDVPVPEGVRLLRVPSLGKRGLSNGGEALLLVGSEGVISRFPLLAAAHAGRSLARRRLDDADDDPAGFAEHGGAGASPGAPNAFDD